MLGREERRWRTIGRSCDLASSSSIFFFFYLPSLLCFSLFPYSLNFPRFLSFFSVFLCFFFFFTISIFSYLFSFSSPLPFYNSRILVFYLSLVCLFAYTLFFSYLPIFLSSNLISVSSSLRLSFSMLSPFFQPSTLIFTILIGYFPLPFYSLSPSPLPSYCLRRRPLAALLSRCHRYISKIRMYIERKRRNTDNRER